MNTHIIFVLESSFDYILKWKYIQEDSRSVILIWKTSKQKMTTDYTELRIKMKHKTYCFSHTFRNRHIVFDWRDLSIPEHTIEKYEGFFWEKNRFRTLQAVRVTISSEHSIVLSHLNKAISMFKYNWSPVSSNCHENCFFRFLIRKIPIFRALLNSLFQFGKSLTVL